MKITTENSSFVNPGKLAKEKRKKTVSDLSKSHTNNPWAT